MSLSLRMRNGDPAITRLRVCGTPHSSILHTSKSSSFGWRRARRCNRSITNGCATCSMLHEAGRRRSTKSRNHSTFSNPEATESSSFLLPSSRPDNVKALRTSSDRTSASQ